MARLSETTNVRSTARCSVSVFRLARSFFVCMSEFGNTHGVAAIVASAHEHALLAIASQPVQYLNAVPKRKARLRAFLR